MNDPTLTIGLLELHAKEDAARIAELEAQCAPDAIQRHYMRGYNAANAKRRRVCVAELEADRDRCSRIIDKLGTDNRRTEAERDELRGELALVRLAYASVVTERDRLKAALTKIANDEEGDYDLLVYVARAALSGEEVTGCR